MPRFLDFLDMINGGGAGASGNTFQGGGLLSDIANAIAKPYGYRERQAAMQQARPMARPMVATRQATPQYSTSGMTPANAYEPAPMPMNPRQAPVQTVAPQVGQMPSMEQAFRDDLFRAFSPRQLQAMEAGGIINNIRQQWYQNGGRF